MGLVPTAFIAFIKTTATWKEPAKLDLDKLTTDIQLEILRGHHSNWKQRCEELNKNAIGNNGNAAQRRLDRVHSREQREQDRQEHREERRVETVVTRLLARHLRPAKKRRSAPADDRPP